MGTAAFYNTDPAASEEASIQSIVDFVNSCAPHKAHIDTAYVYVNRTGAHSENIVGKALKIVGREKVFLATKMGIALPAFNNDSSEPTVRGQLAESLARLGTDYVDLYAQRTISMHFRYYEHRRDVKTPIESLMSTFKACILSEHAIDWANRRWSLRAKSDTQA